MCGTTLSEVLAALEALGLNMCPEVLEEHKVSELWPVPQEVRAQIIDRTIVSRTFTPMPSGKALACELTLENGFVVHGISTVANKSDFDLEIGKTISYAKARQKIWELEAYIAQDQLYKESK